MQGRGAPRGDRRATRGCHFKCSFLGPAPVLPEPKLGEGWGGAESTNLVWELMSMPFEMEAQPCPVLRHSLNHTYFKTTWKNSYFSVSFAIGRHNPFFFFLIPSQYMSNVDSWCKACGEVDLPSELQDLEDAIHHHQGIYEHITLAYSEVSGQIYFSCK